MVHVRGAPYHPQTQGQIVALASNAEEPEVLFEDYYRPGNLENQISACVENYNNQRYYEIIRQRNSRRDRQPLRARYRHH